jgi:protein-S-isoprenylcysteine O-methyltransferase
VGGFHFRKHRTATLDTVNDLFQPGILGPIFGLSEFALLLWKRSGGNARSADSGSLGMLWVVILACLVVATLVEIYFPQAQSEILYRLRAVGAALCIFGLVLRWYSIFYLGRFFTVNVAIASDHQVIDTGPYRFVRHPSYTGALLAFIGLGITYANWLSLIIVVLPVLAAFMRRIGIEEGALSQALGERYTQYMARTKRLIPGVY